VGRTKRYLPRTHSLTPPRTKGAQRNRPIPRTRTARGAPSLDIAERTSYGFLPSDPKRRLHKPAPCKPYVRDATARSANGVERTARVCLVTVALMTLKPRTHHLYHSRSTTGGNENFLMTWPSWRLRTSYLLALVIKYIWVSQPSKPPTGRIRTEPTSPHVSHTARMRPSSTRWPLDQIKSST
jgi:hypothetical protein